MDGSLLAPDMGANAVVSIGHLACRAAACASTTSTAFRRGPLGGRWTDGRTRSLLARGRLCCHCLRLETDAGLMLVDTGFGLRDVADPRSRLSRYFLALLSPDFRVEMTAARQIERLGLRTDDVRHIVMTHLDFDHAGGLDDFPAARVHLLRRERDDAVAQRTWMDRQRFRPQQWGDPARWLTYAPGGERWFGFEGVQSLSGLPPDVLLVPLAGHTHGHAGVAVRSGGRWLLQAGDAYFHAEEMDRDRPRCPPGLRLYQWMLEKDRRARFDNQRRLRELRHAPGSPVDLFSAHDTEEFERLSGRSARLPAEQLR